MDAFQHINHARMVTLLEEARIPWLFYDDRPTKTLRDGAVIVDLHVRYRGQLRHDDTPLDIVMWVDKLRAVDFTVGYEVRAVGAAQDSPASVTATTQIAAFDIEAQRLRRFTPEEKAYLESWRRV
ncbi:thioesterase family protein [Antrihabitans sp. YC3-6]|uniref:Thioesterase family protein n=2 Tax=Antrihabitans TaxID=2799491 RepID=A0A934NWB1_9NOCA|nr:thioesterase family protein [Antrihabitans stalagmiti]